MTRKTYPRLLLNLAAAALLVGTVAGQAQADPVWHFPFKGAPYATNDQNARVTHVGKSIKQAAKQREHYAQSRQSNPSLGGRAGSTPPMRGLTSKASRPSQKVSQAPSADQPAIVAHHKPGYHDGLPRSGKEAISQPQHRSLA
jgi:hypothetical protein